MGKAREAGFYGRRAKTADEAAIETPDSGGDRRTDGRPLHPRPRRSAASRACGPRRLRGEHSLTDYGDYTMVDAGDVFWYFTKAGHPAHPGVVRRALKQNNGRFFIDTQGWSFAAEPGQPGFKHWLADFDALNRRLIEALQHRK